MYKNPYEIRLCDLISVSLDFARDDDMGSSSSHIRRYMTFTPHPLNL